jgi:hypothetical protein
MEKGRSSVSSIRPRRHPTLQPSVIYLLKLQTWNPDFGAVAIGLVTCTGMPVGPRLLAGETKLVPVTPSPFLPIPVVAQLFQKTSAAPELHLLVTAAPEGVLKTPSTSVLLGLLTSKLVQGDSRILLEGVEIFIVCKFVSGSAIGQICHKVAKVLPRIEFRPW